MGRGYAEGLSEAVYLGGARLEDALAAHLRGNFYPPLPIEYVPLAIAAIAAGMDDDYDRILPVPDVHLQPSPRHLTLTNDGEVGIRAGVALDVLRLDTFIEV